MFDQFDTEDDFSLTTKAGNNQSALTMTDLEENPEYLDPIRNYMIDRKGKHFASMDAEEVVDKFTRHMRFFNTNEAVTMSEAVYMGKASDEKKARAGEAYKVYDKLGNVFVNDGIAGAVDGISDYMQSIATSPSTYLGLGAGKVVSMIGGKAGTQTIKKLAQKAYKDAYKKDGKEAARKAFADVVSKSAKGKAFYAAGATGIADATVQGTQDYILQRTEQDAGSREYFDPLQGLFSFATAGLTTGIAMRSISKGGVDKTAHDTLFKKTRRARFQTQFGVKFDEEKKKLFSERFLRGMIKAHKKDKNYRYFRGEAFRGEQFFAEQLAKDIAAGGKVPVFSVDEMGNLTVKEVFKEGDKVRIGKGTLTDTEIEKSIEAFSNPNLVQDIIGNKADGTFILDIAKDAGITFPSGMNEAGKIALALRNLAPDKALKFGAMVYNRTGIHLGDTADIMSRNLASAVSRSFQASAQMLNVAQGNALNSSAALVKGNVKHQMADYDAVVRELAEETAAGTKRADISGYIQNTWKRLLVSAPQTTAANVFGFSQYYMANTVAELMQSGILGVLGTVKGGKLTEQGQKDLAQAKALWQLQGQKLKNFLDPYTTFDTYMEVLEGDPKLKKRIFETFAGGVERTADAFDIDKANIFFKTTEGYVDIANKISGVRLQDSITKSQMFMNGIDKQLRLQKGITFSEAIQKGDFADLDNDVIDKALDETLKSVFAKDYTRKLADRNIFDMPGTLGSAVAKQVEGISNTPGFGFILPFGRFMNNVMATAYHWNPVTGALPLAAAVTRGNKMEAVEALSRGLVGGVVISQMMALQEQNEQKGLAWNELETGGGDVIDVTNTFPFSLAMVGGRYINTSLKGGETRELREDFLKQIAIGQAATDLQFGNDLTKMLATFEGMIQDGDGQSVALMMNGIAGTVGNVASGFTRPFDPVNRLVGAASGMDTAIDRRKADGVGKLTVNASKYVDNIIEALRGELMGDELRLGVREGKIYDPSPIRTMTGVKVKQPRTSANIVFGMVNMPDWKVGMYSGVPEHDAFVNKVMTPMLERESEDLLRNQKFKNASLNMKRLMADKMLQNVKKTVRETLTDRPSTEQGIDYRRKLLDRVKGARLREARRITGIDTRLRDLSLREIETLETAIDIIKDRE